MATEAHYCLHRIRKATMYKTIEQQVRKHDAPPTLRREFRQHDFESLHSFCLLIFCISMGT